MIGLSAYRRTNVSTGSAPQIMVALFQAALANMRASTAAFERGELKAGSVLAGKAAAIVLGLHGTLKDEVAPDLCARLKELYTFVAWRLGVAGCKFSAQHVREAERVFVPIASAFEKAVRVSSGTASPPDQG
ncbi:MAG: flagellar protein FliS [Polyangia bacterium]